MAPFAKGQSGNPAGRRPSAPNPVLAELDSTLRVFVLRDDTGSGQRFRRGAGGL